MKIKTANLTGPALDWAVAKCEGRENDGTWDENFSTNWLLSGPIIEREKISVYWNKPRQQWVAMHGGHLRFYRGHTTPLIAAMRCYVQAHFGDDIDIPEELA